jgi:hypothetical protein
VVTSGEAQITETCSNNHHDKEQPRTGKNECGAAKEGDGIE